MVSRYLETALDGRRTLAQDDIHGTQSRRHNRDYFVRYKQRLTYLEGKQG